MVSVAIATCNGERFLCQQLLSIYNQTVQVDEVIISDDVSTDNTVAIAKAFINEHNLKNWKIIVNDVRLGCSDNFFSAIKRTTGDIIFLSDQDDEWEMNKVEIMSLAIHSRDNICALSSRYSLINAVGEVIPNSVINHCGGGDFGNLEEIPLSFLVGTSVIKGCSMCISKEVRFALMQLPGLQLKNSLGHDWFLNVIASIIGKNFIINRNLFKYRIHESNLSLGGLRKTHLLSATNTVRNGMFHEIIGAQQYLLENKYLSDRLTAQDKRNIIRMVSFFKKRLKFTSTKNIFTFISLVFEINYYLKCEKKIKLAFRMYLSDFLYAYNINWRFRKG